VRVGVVGLKRNFYKCETIYECFNLVLDKTSSKTARDISGIGKSRVTQRSSSGGGDSSKTVAVNPVTYEPDSLSTFRVSEGEVGKPPVGSGDRSAYVSGAGLKKSSPPLKPSSVSSSTSIDPTIKAMFRGQVNVSDVKSGRAQAFERTITPSEAQVLAQQSLRQDVGGYKYSGVEVSSDKSVDPEVQRRSQNILFKSNKSGKIVGESNVVKQQSVLYPMGEKPVFNLKNVLFDTKTSTGTSTRTGVVVETITSPGVISRIKPTLGMIGIGLNKQAQAVINVLSPSQSFTFLKSNESEKIIGRTKEGNIIKGIYDKKGNKIGEKTYIRTSGEEDLNLINADISNKSKLGFIGINPFGRLSKFNKNVTDKDVLATLPITGSFALIAGTGGAAAAPLGFAYGYDLTKRGVKAVATKDLEGARNVGTETLITVGTLGVAKGLQLSPKIKTFDVKFVSEKPVVVKGYITKGKLIPTMETIAPLTDTLTSYKIKPGRKVSGYETVRTRTVEAKGLKLEVGISDYPLVTYGKGIKGVKFGNQPLFKNRVSSSEAQITDFTLTTPTISSRKVKGAGLALENFKGTIEGGESIGLASPAGSIEFKTMQKVVKFTPEELARQNIDVKLARKLRKDKGIKNQEFFARQAFERLPGLKNPKESAKLIEQFLYEKDYKPFGSTTAELLGNKWKTLKPGDIDAYANKKTVQEIEMELPELVSGLKALGEDIRISPSGKGTIVEFAPTKGVSQGEKLIEVKSGINQIEAGLVEDVGVPVGFAGVKFANVKAGQFGKTVPFGNLNAMTPGESFTRKIAGANILSTGQRGETPSFSGVGVLGKQGNPRGLKDTAGVFQYGKGLQEIRGESWNPFKKSGSQKIGNLIEKRLGTYTTEQQADILLKLSDVVGNGEKIKVPLSFDTPAASRSFTLSSNVRASLFSNIGSRNVGGSLSSGFASPSGGRSVFGSSFGSSASGLSSPSTSVIGSSSGRSVFGSRSGFSSGGSSFSSPSSSPTSVSPSTFSPSSFKSSFPSTGKSPSPISPFTSTSPFSPLSPSPTPRSPFPKSPFSPNTPRLSSTPPTRFTFPRNKDGGMFSVDIRSKGKFVSVGGGLNLKDAISLGKGLTGGSSARSFKIKTRAGKSLTGLNIGKDYYKKGDVYIEKSGVSINTGGELKQITFKGIASQKRKSIGVF